MIGLQCTSTEQGYDLLLKGGKAVVGETTAQNQAFILLARKGDFKEHPLLGVGLQDITNDHDFASWERLVTEQLEADGMQIDKLEITSQGLTLDAHYKRQ